MKIQPKKKIACKAMRLVVNENSSEKKCWEKKKQNFVCACVCVLTIRVVGGPRELHRIAWVQMLVYGKQPSTNSRWILSVCLAHLCESCVCVCSVFDAMAGMAWHGLHAITMAWMMLEHEDEQDDENNAHSFHTKKRRRKKKICARER